MLQAGEPVKRNSNSLFGGKLFSRKAQPGASNPMDWLVYGTAAVIMVLLGWAIVSRVKSAGRA